jgi:hypothetical protein
VSRCSEATRRPGIASLHRTLFDAEKLSEGVAHDVVFVVLDDAEHVGGGP